MSHTQGHDFKELSYGEVELPAVVLQEEAQDISAIEILLIIIFRKTRT